MGTSAGTSEIYSNQVSLQDSIPQRPATYVRGVFQGQLATTACSPQRPATSDRGVFQGQLARQAQPSPSDASTAERETSSSIASDRSIPSCNSIPCSSSSSPKDKYKCAYSLGAAASEDALAAAELWMHFFDFTFQATGSWLVLFFSFDSHLRLSAIGLFLHGLFDFEGIERQPWRLRCSFLASLFD